MFASTRAFLTQIIDYAGMFPPAKLPLDEALRKYLHYRAESPHAWMLGRFVCPVAQLEELFAQARSHANASLLQVTVLLPATPGENEWHELEQHLAAIQDFRQRWGSDAVIDMLEMPVPGEVADPRMPTCQGFVLGETEVNGLQGFLEVPKSKKWAADFDQAIDRMLETGWGHPVGLKLRCGGMTAEAFPKDEQVAHFIIKCGDIAVPWKATAGLHHPRRHWDASLKLWHHGFLNVIGAGVLVSSHDEMEEEDVVAILADREGKHFRFDDAGFAWKKWRCTTEQIAEARLDSAVSFGSCSFTEPCDDLLAMGLI